MADTAEMAHVCLREMEAFDSAILRLKIGLGSTALGRPLDRPMANQLAEDLANAATKFSLVGRCIGRTIARGR
jgi:hypothetical protein